MEKISKQLEGLEKAYEELAESSKFDDSDVYNCLKCKDCGWIIEGDIATKCSCQKEKEADVKSLGIPRLRNMVFSKFDKKLYPVHLKTPTSGRTYRQAAEEARLEAYEFTTSIARGINRPGLIFEGEVGSGKTFLAAAIANELLKKGIDVEFVVVPELLDNLRQNFSRESNNNSSIIERTQTAQVLVLDDLGAHNYSDWVQNTLFNIVNYRLNHQLPIIVTTNLNITDLRTEIGDRIASRLFESGKIVRLYIEEDIRFKLAEEGHNKW